MILNTYLDEEPKFEEVKFLSNFKNNEREFQNVNTTWLFLSFSIILVTNDGTLSPVILALVSLLSF